MAEDGHDHEEERQAGHERSVTFTGKLGKRKLGKGTYRIVAIATAGGQTSAKKTLTFTIVRR